MERKPPIVKRASERIAVAVMSMLIDLRSCPASPESWPVVYSSATMIQRPSMRPSGPWSWTLCRVMTIVRSLDEPFFSMVAVTVTSFEMTSPSYCATSIGLPGL